MWETFEWDARSVVSRGIRYAEDEGSESLAPMHLLRAFFDLDSPESRRLRETGLRLPPLAVVRPREPDPLAMTPDEGMPLSDGAKSIVVRTFEEARLLDHHYVTVQHLALSIVREPEIAAFLRSKKLDPAAIYRSLGGRMAAPMKRPSLLARIFRRG